MAGRCFPRVVVAGVLVSACGLGDASPGAIIGGVTPPSTSDAGRAPVRDARSSATGDVAHGAEGGHAYDATLAADASDATGTDAAIDGNGDAKGDGPARVDASDAARDETGGSHDAASGKDAEHDAGHVEHDAGHEAGHKDAGHDSGHDAGHDSGHDSGHDAGMPLPGTHLTNQTIQVKTGAGTVTRSYDITIPVMCDSANLAPLVFALHGDGGDGADMYATFPIEAAAAAAKDRAIFVYPDGTNDNIDPSGNPNAWNLFDDPGFKPYNEPDPTTPDNDDIDFFDAMIASFEATLCVDKTRIFITGISSGGYAANQFARWRSAVYRGTAPMSGGAPFGNPDGNPGPNGSDFAPPQYCVATTNAMAALIIHGAADTEVDPSNAVQAQGYWEMANSCPGNASNCSGGNLGATCATAPTTPSPCVAPTGCKAGVTLCMIPGLGHEIWVDAPATVWSFFASL